MFSWSSIAALKCAFRHALVALQKKFYPLTPAQLADGAGITCHLIESSSRAQVELHTRRRFGGRQPLCGIGVTSVIAVIFRPADCNERIAASRPEPGPLTYTSICRRPCSIALRAADSAVTCAA